MEAPTVTADDGQVFPSFASMRAAQSLLLKRQRELGDTPEIIRSAHEFLRRGQATGALLDDDVDRQAAQSLLDFWATRLFRLGQELPPATLADFDPRLAPELDDVLCPYLGLEAFREEHQGVFFGREQFVARLVNRLSTSRLLAVVGPSGSGKSSLVRAGLIPALKRGALPGSSDWVILPTIVPGTDPLAALAKLAPAEGVEPAAWARQQAELFRRDPGHFARLAQARFGNVVLVVDQFEETFTLCGDEADRQAFVDNLVGLAKAEGAAHRVILTMRTDFETYVARLPEFQPLFQEAKEMVGPLSASELRQAIEAPAAKIGLKFEDGLVTTLLNDILGEPAALPLLQFTLLKLWERRERNRVTWETYRRLGGGRNALAKAADEFYSGLIPEEQVTARRLLLRMVKPGEGLEVTSDRVRRADLYPGAVAHDRIDRVLDKLIAARLVRQTGGQAEGDTQVEVAHEALVRNWPQLVDWLEDERARLRERKRLTAAAAKWNELGREAGALWRGAQLTEAQQYDDLNALELEFVNASRQAQEAEQRRQEEDARRLRALNRRITVLAALAVIAAVLAVIFAVQANQKADQLGVSLNAEQVAKQTAEAAQRVAEAQARILATTGVAEKRSTLSRQLAAQAGLDRDDRLDLAILLALEAYWYDPKTEGTPSLETTSSLLSVLATSPQLSLLLDAPDQDTPVQAMAFSAGGRSLVTVDAAGNCVTWDLETAGRSGARPQVGNERCNWGASADALALSPDGGVLAVALSPSASDEQLTVALRGEGLGCASLSISAADVGGRVLTLAFGLDGLLAVGGQSGAAGLWSVDDCQKVQEAPASSGAATIPALAFSAEGGFMAIGDDTGKVLLVFPDGEPVADEVDIDPEIATALALSPDGQQLFVGQPDGRIRVWQLAGASPLEASPLAGHTAPVVSLAVSADGQRLASAGENGKVIVWDLSEGQPLGRRVASGLAGLTHVVFTPDGQPQALSLAGDLEIRDLATGQVTVEPLERTPRILVNPTGRVLAMRLTGGGPEPVGNGGPARTGGYALGIDVTRWTPSVDWSAVKSSGVSFVYVKASQASFTDPMFVTHWAGSKEAGLLRGAYHFFEASPSPDKQAEHFLKTLGDDLGELPLVVDLEGRTSNAAQYAQDAETFLQIVEARTGRRPMIYTAKWYWNSTMLINGQYPDFASEYSLWVGSYPVMEEAPAIADLERGRYEPVLPNSWDSWLFWQYSENGRVDGIVRDGRPANVTLNVFNGSVEDLSRLAAVDTTITATAGTALVLWDMTAGEALGPKLPVQGTSSLAVSWDLSLLAVGRADGSIELQDLQTGAQVQRLLLPARAVVSSIALSPGNAWLAAGDAAGNLHLFDLNTRAYRRLGKRHESAVRSLAFDAAGRRLASGGEDGRVQFWDIATGRPIALPFVGHTEAVISLAFSPDGKTLLSASGDQDVRSWSLDLDVLLAQACRMIAGRPLTEAEWQQYFGNEARHQVCPQP